MPSAVSESPAVATSIHSVPVVAGLEGSIARVRVGALYRPSLLVVAVAMLVLPMIYIALIIGTGYLVYLHAINDTFLLESSGRAALVRVFAYLAPIVVGGVIVVFMIKPLFARERRIQAPLTVDEREQPVLHAFVHKLADIVGAPRPKRIDVDCHVNASASFDQGFRGFLRGDLVLTIGLPLVVGLDARQLSGVLAHELGHFAQGGALRLAYVIRSINGWFARVVYDRDDWDDALQAAAGPRSHLAVRGLARVAALMVWTARQILKLLMIIGHGVSAFMLRQMEFDADRYQARIAGCEAFAQVAEKLALLQVASQAALNDLSAAWREQRLCDDLPALVQWRESDMPADIRQKVVEHARLERTRWFDTHPCDTDRITNARRDGGQPLFQFDAPASALFRDLTDLSRRATVAFYHRAFGGAVRLEHLISTESMVASRTQTQQHHGALRRYFQGLIHPIRPVFLEGTIDRIGDRDAAAEMLLDLRAQFLSARPEAQAAAEAWAQCDQRLVAVARLKSLRNAGVKKIAADVYKLSTLDDDALRKFTCEQRACHSQAQATLAHALTLGMQRMELALRLKMDAPPVLKSDANAFNAEGGLLDVASASPSCGRPLEEALRSLSAAAPTIEAIRQHSHALAALLSACQLQANDEHLIGAVLSSARKTLAALAQLRDPLGRVPYPYDHLDRTATVYSFILQQLPAADAVGDVAHAAETALESLYSLYMRLLSDLAACAEAVEQSLGMPALPEPPNQGR
jgi:Zn-dependent protease with chaperone function